MSNVKLGIVGCGTVAEHHIPAALAAAGVDLIAISDSRADRLLHVRETFGLHCLAAESHSALIGKVDAVLLSLPNHLHYPIARDFLNKGIHVLCEKPLANTTHDAKLLCDLAEAAELVLAVGYMKRFEPNCDVMKRLIDDGFLGKLERFEFEQGGAGDWSPVSGYNLSREHAGGGVLMTNGCHFLDRMLFWFGYPSTVTYRDDSHGGVEANCSAVFTFDSGLTGLVTLSKTHSLSNRFRLIGERGRLEIDNAEHTTVTFFPALDSQFKHDISANGGQNGLTDTDYFRLQIEDFARAIRTRTRPRVTGRDGLSSIELIEQCYQARTPLDESWIVESLPHRNVAERHQTCVSTGTRPHVVPHRERSGNGSSSRPDRVLITGGNGFVGSRLSEVLYLTGDYQARPLIHSPGKASYIARYPLEFVTGDLTDFASARRTVEGCPQVVHLARGSKSVMLKGLENLLRASVAGRVKRFVHASSVAVYGDNPPAAARYETAPTRKTGNDYGDLKLEQEELVAHYGKRFGLPYVILRPPFIVGPRSHFVEALIRGLAEQRIPIVEGGSNVCNMVYVDNFIEAILLALDKDEAIGETFFITDKEQIRWRQYLDDFGAMMSVDVPRASLDQLAAPPVPSSREALRQLTRMLLSDESRSALMNLPLVGTVGRTLYAGYASLSPKQQRYVRMKLKPSAAHRRSSSEPRRYDATDYLISAQRRTVAHSCEKAQRILGYTSSVSYATAMALTQQWLRYTGVISAGQSQLVVQHREKRFQLMP